MGKPSSEPARPKALEALQDIVTAKIINHLKEGVPPWVRPWKISRRNGIGIVPCNAVTGRPYTGGNIILLWLAAEEKDYATNGWMTYNQANELKARVRGGEKATQITYTKYVEKEEEASGGKQVRRIPFVRVYSVFHTSQIDNLPESYKIEIPTSLAPSHNRALIECIERVTGHTQDRPRILYRGNRAAYLPNRDVIEMPGYKTFASNEAFLGTLAHEGIHFTGAKDRLNRQFGKRFGDPVYRFEELVAELGSAFLCAHFGIEATYRSAQYVQSWITCLEKDSQAIFSAASHASQAVGWLLEHGAPQEVQEAAE